MNNKRLMKVLGLLLVVALLLVALPQQAKAQEGGDTLNVAKWSEPAELVNVSGRETVLKVGDTYHMWYSNSAETELYHTTSSDPASFSTGTINTFTGGSPAEVGSVSVVKDGETFYMVAYGATNKVFAIYSSSDGTAWTYGSVIFDGTSLPAYNKIDGPFLFLDGTTYRLYFQVKTPDTSPTQYAIYTAEASTITGSYSLANSGNPVLSPTSDAWDGAWIMHPWVVKDNGTYFMWYSAYGPGFTQQIGMAKSNDGYTWVKSPGNPIIGPVGEPSVIKDGDTWRLWHLAAGSKINYLTATGPFEFQSIQAAVDAASDRDTINVAAGEYNEVGQIVIDKALTIQGAGSSSTIIKKVEDTGDPSSGDNRAWILVTSNGSLDISNLTLDGATKKIAIGIMANNTTSIDSLVIKNIAWNATTPDYYGRGAVFYGGSGHLVIDTTFENIGRIGIFSFGAGIDVDIDGITYTGKGTGDWLDYGIEFGGGATGTIVGSTITDNLGVASDHSTSAGILVTTYYGSGTAATITGNTLTGNTSGIAVGYGEDDTSTVVAHNNKIVGNEVGIVSTAPTVDASPNWWGSVAGPAEGAVVGDVKYNPWCYNEECTILFVAEGGSIQDAIDAAPADGTVLVEAGTYPDDLIINKSLTLKADTKPVIIDPESGAAITITAGTVRLEGLTIQNADVGVDVGNVINTGRNVILSPALDVNIQYCSFEGNGKHINNVAGVQVKAENNWWGYPDGPAEGSIEGNVDYVPWSRISDITLDTEDIDENLPAGTLVGSFTLEDADPNEVYVLELVDTEHYPDNASFTIDGLDLKSAAIFDFETEDSYSIYVRATDSWGNIFEKAFVIEVNDVNEAPVLTLQFPEEYEGEIDELVEFTFTASAEDEEDAQTLSFELVGAPEGAEIVPGTGVFNWTPSEAQGPGEYTFTVKVCDDAEEPLCDEEEVTIIVNEVNVAPVANVATYYVIDEPLVVDAAQGVLSHVTDADVPANELTAVLVTDIPEGEGTLVLNADGSFTYTPPEEAPASGQTSFTYKANDGTADSNDATVTLSIRFDNESPTALNLTPLTTAENVAYTGALSTTDPDGDTDFVYTLVSGTGDEDNGLFTIDGSSLKSGGFNYEEKPAYHVRIRTTDNFGGYYERAFTINVTDVNDAPVLEEIGPQEVDELSELTFTAHATDDELPYQTLTFSIVGELPTGAAFVAETATFSWTPTEVQGAGEYTVTVKVCDDADEPLCDQETVTITVNEVNQAPVLTLPEGLPTEVNEHVAFTFTASATDGDIPTQTLTFSLGDDAPDGANIGELTGGFIWTPGEEQQGEHSFTVLVCDNFDPAGCDQELVTVTVIETNEAPVAENDAYGVINQPLIVDAADGVLANDNDDDIPAQTLTAELVEPYGEGELILNADGSFTYTPPTELPEGGQTVFTYEVSDGQDGTDQATITFAIRLENAAPTDISLDPLSVAENEPYEGTLATVDTDLPNDAHVYALVAGIGDTDNGAFTIDGDQLVANEPFNYEVKASYNVRIRSTDLFGAWYEKRFVISVQDANDAPVAEDDEFAIKQGEEVDITLKATDEDEDGLTFAIFDEPEHGEVVVNTVGTTINTASGILRVIEPQVTYIPDEGWAGVDSFTFKAIDDKGALSNLATITITVNDAPVAVDDEYETDEDASLTVEAEEGVLANDSDVYPEEPLTAILVSDVTHGELNLAEEGSFVYIPEANFFGEDSFTYKASDGELESEPATVTITIAAVNDAPVAEDIEAETAEDEAVEITLVASDVEDDELTAEIVVEPLHGEVTLEGFTATYTPDPDYNGMDSFTYKVNDGELYSEPATVTITVAAVNDAPVAADIEAETDEDTAVEITLVASDVDSDELTAEIVDPPLHGEVTLEGFTATYTPDLDYNGIDSFTYKASDGELESEPATVTIAVLPVNDGPQAVDDEYETLMGVPLEVSAPGVMENDIDPDEGDVWTVELVSDVSHGTLVFKSDGSFTYEPDAGFYGVDTFTYLLISVPGVNSEYSDTATVTITVRPAVRIFLPIILK